MYRKLFMLANVFIRQMDILPIMKVIFENYKIVYQLNLDSSNLTWNIHFI